MRSLPLAIQPARKVTAASTSSSWPRSVMDGISSRMVPIPSAPPIRQPTIRRPALCRVSPTVPSETKKQVITQVWIPGQSVSISTA